MNPDIVRCMSGAMRVRRTATRTNPDTDGRPDGLTGQSADFRTNTSVDGSGSSDGR